MVVLLLRLVLGAIVLRILSTITVVGHALFLATFGGSTLCRTGAENTDEKLLDVLGIVVNEIRRLG